MLASFMRRTSADLRLTHVNTTAGGVGTSGLEMSQNSLRMSWTRDEVDAQLEDIMKLIHRTAAQTAREYGREVCLSACLPVCLSVPPLPVSRRAWVRMPVRLILNASTTGTY